MENKKEFIELIKLYRTMTPEHMRSVLNSKPDEDMPLQAANILTGFGGFNSCTLCRKIAKKGCLLDCITCTWMVLTGYKCNRDSNQPTYSYIDLAFTIKELSFAYQQRADRMAKLLYDHNKISKTTYLNLQNNGTKK